MARRADRRLNGCGLSPTSSSAEKDPLGRPFTEPGRGIASVGGGLFMSFSAKGGVDGLSETD